MKEENDGMYYVAGGIGAIALIAALLAWQGYVLTILWGWFITPAFGLTVPSVPLAIGVALVCSMLTKQHVPSNKDEPGWYALGRGIASPTLALFIGWVVTRFM